MNNFSINLNYIFLISSLFISSLLFISSSIDNIKTRLISTYNTKYLVQADEIKLMLPYVLRTFYKSIIENLKNLPFIIRNSFWTENSEFKFEKEQAMNKNYVISVLKRISLTLSVFLYALILVVWIYFKPRILDYQLTTNKQAVREFSWNIFSSGSNVTLAFGLDSLALPFIILTVIIFPLSLLSNWTSIPELDVYYLIMMSALELLLLGVFLVIDLILFYVSFESILPFLFIIIGLYGAAQKNRAGFYLFLYTLFGSLFMLVSFTKVTGDVASAFYGTSEFEEFFQFLQAFMWAALFISFSVKTPIVPFHIWLPLAHSDANVSGSIVLASVVLKLALYGFIRVLIGILIIATLSSIPYVFAMCGISILYSSFTTIRQFDLKVLVAYSSIAHMGSTILGTFSDTLYGLLGSIIFGLGHGLVSPALFIIVGAVLYDRCGSRIINYYKGLTSIVPVLTILFLFFIFGNMGVPLTGNFIGEFLSLLGAYQQNIFIASIGATSIILSAVYSIFMYNRVTGGSVSPYIHTIPDLFRKEFYLLLPLVIFTLILGIYPYFITSEIEFGLSNFLLFGISPIILQPNTSNANNNNSNNIEETNNNNNIEDINSNNNTDNNDNNIDSDNDSTTTNYSDSDNDNQKDIDTQTEIDSQSDNDNNSDIWPDSTLTPLNTPEIATTVPHNTPEVATTVPIVPTLNNTYSNQGRTGHNIVGNSSLNSSITTNTLNSNSNNNLESIAVGNVNYEEGQALTLPSFTPKNHSINSTSLRSRMEDIIVEGELSGASRHWTWMTSRNQDNNGESSTLQAINEVIESRNRRENEIDNNNSNNNNNSEEINNNNNNNNEEINATNINSDINDNDYNGNNNNINAESHNRNTNNANSSNNVNGENSNSDAGRSTQDSSSNNSNKLNSILDEYNFDIPWLDWVIDNFNMEAIYWGIALIFILLWIGKIFKYFLYKYRYSYRYLSIIPVVQNFNTNIQSNSFLFFNNNTVILNSNLNSNWDSFYFYINWYWIIGLYAFLSLFSSWNNIKILFLIIKLDKSFYLTVRDNFMKLITCILYLRYLILSLTFISYIFYYLCNWLSINLKVVSLIINDISYNCYFVLIYFFEYFNYYSMKDHMYNDYITNNINYIIYNRDFQDNSFNIFFNGNNNENENYPDDNSNQLNITSDQPINNNLPLESNNDNIPNNNFDLPQEEGYENNYSGSPKSVEEEEEKNEEDENGEKMDEDEDDLEGALDRMDIYDFSTDISWDSADYSDKDESDNNEELENNEEDSGNNGDISDSNEDLCSNSANYDDSGNNDKDELNKIDNPNINTTSINESKNRGDSNDSNYQGDGSKKRSREYDDSDNDGDNESPMPTKRSRNNEGEKKIN